ncbi:phosphonate metabolism protein/1,5-bisphosphokinase (PRPP-forming) PhnN [Variovorax sp. MHTC-1]|uniref:phosphonate metabolism protein/1,5-bisphosphokinase (PRPP-forming) PhnN n=1 Tax=Variovorax sp. MHTC-1 TaxID=2495593 RepID=UPI000F88EB7B|nr:phosphonate metabolism protein/1,5-bisphosphokinase (PRPP-forming) PhnN [Variovorax sp. MHTC-1]RST56198.1 phosphonate metabolism protein/1,5-bisphosphokinase (PRPP-forming) PhnN [Variovorax sp. MHTC-1]
MKGQLVYVMGPSGAGKDSLLAWLEDHLPPHMPMHLARRTITRPPRSGDEQHHSVSAQAFEQLNEAQAFAFDWQANGLRYGVRHDELSPLHLGKWVIVNGSRAYLPQALERFPHLTVVYVTASIEVLRQRLLARGRETPVMVDARVRRALAFKAPAHAIEVRNDGALAEAGAQLLQAFERLQRPASLRSAP